MQSKSILFVVACTCVRSEVQARQDWLLGKCKVLKRFYLSNALQLTGKH
jgi:hypothetical protein